MLNKDVKIQHVADRKRRNKIVEKEGEKMILKSQKKLAK